MRLILFSLLVSVLCARQLGKRWAIAETKNYLKEVSPEKSGLSVSEVDDLSVSDAYMSKHTQVHHVYLTQSVYGRVINNVQFHTNVNKKGGIFGGDVPHLKEGEYFFVKNATQKTNMRFPKISEQDAILAACAQLAPLKEQIKICENLVVKKQSALPGNVIFEGGELSMNDIPVKLVYFYDSVEDELRLAYETNIYLFSTVDWFDITIDAENGDLLREINWVSQDTYEVYSIPMESPLTATDGRRDIDTNPSDTSASPFGWHDIDGVVGADFTDTRGNNVYAQEDRAGNNILGRRPDGGPDLVFEYDFDDETMEPVDYTDAATTNLFYWNNVIHDVLYEFGFDEESGNFQKNNYGNGGREGDQVYADCQDGSGVNNANFATPPDGNSGRMQMYEWLDPANRKVVLNNGKLFAGSAAAFGPSTEVTKNTPLSITQPANGCEPLKNFPSGAIAVIDRGDCSFVEKVQFAQNAGAVSVIIVNNEERIAGMAGSSSTIEISSMQVSHADGTELKAYALAGAEGQVGALSPRNRRDSDFDSGIMAHEYCHGLSIRLTGGPSSSSCLSGAQQAGEGWSDFCALYFTARSDETRDMPRGMGGYVIYLGTHATIRPAPYTPNKLLNPFTYADISSQAVPHGVGFVWATALWDVYWNLVDTYGFDSNLYTGTGGNNLAFQLVLDGLKLQGCRPDFLTARDAIIDADFALTNGQNYCDIWNGFAGRGMGVNAVSGGSNSLSVEEDFTVPRECF